MNSDTAFQNWQRRDVAVDFVVACVLMACLPVIVGLLL